MRLQHFSSLNGIAKLYTNNPEIIEKASNVFFMWTVGVIFDVCNIMNQGVLRGAGKQYITSVWNLGMSIFWMIPVSYILCFQLGWDVYGIWLGCISYVVILGAINFCYVIFMDVEKASEIITKQLESRG